MWCPVNAIAKRQARQRDDVPSRLADAAGRWMAALLLVRSRGTMRERREMGMYTEPRDEARDLMRRALMLLDTAGEHAAAASLAAAIDVLDGVDACAIPLHRRH